MNSVEAVEKILEYMKALKLSQAEAVIVAQYVSKTLEYNSLKEDITFVVKNELLKDLEVIKNEIKNKK